MPYHISLVDGYTTIKRQVRLMINRIVDPDRTGSPRETPEPNSVPHPQTSPLEFPTEAEPVITSPPRGDFLIK